MKLFSRFQSSPDVEAMQARGDVQGLLDVLSDSKWGKSSRGRKILDKATEALVSIGSPQVVQGFVDLLDGNIRSGRGWASHGLVRLVRRYGRARIEHVIQRLLTMVVSGDLAQAAYAVPILAAAKAPEAFAPVVQRLSLANRSKSPERWWARRALIQALGEFGDPRGVDPIVEALRFREKASYLEDDVWKAAAYALGACGDIRAVQPLVDMLIDPRADRAWHSGFAKEAELILLQLAKRGCLQDPRALPPLVTLTKNRMPRSANCGVRILGECGNPDSVDALLAAMERRDTATAASKSLCKYRDPRSARPLIDALISGLKIDSGVRVDEDCARWLSYNCVRDDIGRLIATIKREGYFTSARWHQRLAAAWMLMEMYQSGRLDDTVKRLLLAQKRTIEQPHSDTHTDHTDYGGPHYDDRWGPHTDTITDEGIGIQFPP